jgi:hypothetical protein
VVLKPNKKSTKKNIPTNAKPKFKSLGAKKAPPYDIFVFSVDPSFHKVNQGLESGPPTIIGYYDMIAGYIGRIL